MSGAPWPLKPSDTAIQPLVIGENRAALAVSCAQLLSLTFVNQAHFLNVLVMLVLPQGLALRRSRSDDRPTLYGAGGSFFSASGSSTSLSPFLKPLMA